MTAWLRVLYELWISKAQIETFERDQRKTDTDAAFTAGVQIIKHLLRLRHFARTAREETLRLLDFGCGGGRFLALAAALGFRSYGIDFSAARQELAQKREMAIVESLEQFDALKVSELHAVTLFQVLEHVPEPLQLLSASRPSGSRRNPVG